MASKVTEGGWKSSCCEDLIDLIWLFDVAVDVMEGLACPLDRQGGDVQALAIWRYGGNAGCNDKTNVAELSQFHYQIIDLPFISPMWVENRLGIVEDNDHFLRG